MTGSKEIFHDLREEEIIEETEQEQFERLWYLTK